MKKVVFIALISVVCLFGCARIGPVVQNVSYDEETNELLIQSNTYVVPIGILGDLFYFPGAHWEGASQYKTIKLNGASLNTLNSVQRDPGHGVCKPIGQ